MFKALNYFNWRDRPQRETIAYLTLPCKRHVQDIAARDSSDENEFDYIVNNAASISNVIDPATLVISNEQKRRFHKAMKFLDLNPKIYNFQVVDDYDKDGPILTKEQKTNGPSVKEAEGICNRLDEKVKGKPWVSYALMSTKR